MKRMTRAWIVGAATLLPFLLLSIYLPPLLNLTGPIVWIARTLLLVLGVVAGLIVFLYLRARAKALPEPVKQDDEIDSAIVQARTRLAAAKSGAKLGKVPIVLFVGPTASTKTTVVTRSGLDPELLAGEVTRGENVLPTRAVNVWYAEDAVLLEAGGKLLTDAPRWGRLLRHLQPSRLATLLPGGKQAPRAAVVCIGCDELLKPSAGESVPALAQTIRARLIEVAGQLGIRLPVYVLFTKADRLPYFGDYVRNWTQEETSDLLGATLPLASRAEPGSYAERAAGRVGGAFETLFRSLAGRRLDVLPRETGEEVRGGAYEFPREFRKVVPLATQFLIDLCRPSQLGVSPFLRGFYFTGVRPIVLDEGVVAPSVPAPVQRGTPVDATSVFDARALVAQQHAHAQSRGGRRVPEWAFLRRLLGGIILRDAVARAVTAGGTRVNLLRRLAVGTVAAGLAFLCIAFFVSWRANDNLIDRTLVAADSVSSVDLSGAGVPTIDDLGRLDSLRAQLALLRRWDTAGAPLSHRWGLYAGDDVLDTLRALYFDRFERMLWSGTRGKLVASLQALPERPNEASEYGATYNALKAYLITTDHPHESRVDFLAPELMRHWRYGRDIDEEPAAIAERQFAFFAAELPFGNPYGHTQQATLVADSRRFLRAFGDSLQLYQALIAEASDSAPSVRFEGAGVVTDPVIVPGAFTDSGWVFVQDRLNNVDQLFDRESWVLGEATVPAGDRARIARSLRQRYVTEYIGQWQQYLAEARIANFAGTQDAANKLNTLSSGQSPLLRLFNLAARHTAVDTTDVRQAFQPVHAVMPPDTRDPLIVEANQQYMGGLLALQTNIGQVASAPAADRGGAIANANSTAGQIKNQVGQMAQGFSSGGAAQPVASAVTRLLLAPVTNAEGLLGGIPAAQLNAGGGAFCDAFAPVLRKYPFNPRADAQSQAAIDEVDGLFKPGASLLSAFYEEQLSGLLARRGDTYVPTIGAALRATPAFTTFFNRATRISDALYTPTGEGPYISFTLAPQTSAEVTEVQVEMAGVVHTWTRTVSGVRPFAWQAEPNGTARIVANLNGPIVTVAQGAGPWAVFQVFHQADNWQQLGTGRYRVRWRIPNSTATLSADLSFDEGIPIFDPSYFAGITCPRTIVSR
jgi:type VI secretion system protein ImpL